MEPVLQFTYSTSTKSAVYLSVTCHTENKVLTSNMNVTEISQRYQDVPDLTLILFWP